MAIDLKVWPVLTWWYSAIWTFIASTFTTVLLSCLHSAVAALKCWTLGVKMYLIRQNKIYGEVLRRMQCNLQQFLSKYQLCCQDMMPNAVANESMADWRCYELIVLKKCTDLNECTDRLGCRLKHLKSASGCYKIFGYICTQMYIRHKRMHCGGMPT